MEEGILAESFPTDGREVQDLPDTARWYNSNPLTIRYTAGESVGAWDGHHLVAYLTDSGTLDLQPGETLEVEYDLQMIGTAAEGSGKQAGLRFGFYDSGGQRVTADDQNTANDLFLDYTGYTAYANINAGETAMTLLQRNPESGNTNLLNSVDAHDALASDLGERGGSFVDGETYTVTLSIEHTAEGEITLTTSITGGDLTGYFGTVTVSENLVNSFDTFAVLASNGVNTEYDLTRVEVTRSTAIEEDNEAPIVVRSVPQQELEIGNPLELVLPADVFADPDGDNVTYNLNLEDGTDLPAWMTYNSATRTLGGTPEEENIGEYRIQLTGDDGRGGSASTSFSVIVRPANDDPIVVTEIDDINALSGDATVYELPDGIFEDPNGDLVTVSVALGDGSDLPEWMSYNDGILAFDAASAVAGEYTIAVTGQDGFSGSAQTTFTVTVEEGSTSPVAEDLANHIILNDLFREGIYTLDQPPRTGRWFSSLPVWLIDDGEGWLRCYDRHHMLNYFEVDEQPITLEVGESLEVTAVLDFINTAPEGEGGEDTLRLGFFDSRGTRVGADGTSAFATEFEDNTGYFMAASMNIGEGAVSFWRRPPNKGNGLIHADSSFTRMGPAQGLREGSFTDEVMYTAHFKIQRVAEDRLLLTTSVEGGDISGYEGSMTIVGDPQITYDMFGITVTKEDSVEFFDLNLVNIAYNRFDDTNDAPIVLGKVDDVTVRAEGALDYTWPWNVFYDDEGDPLTISATLADGSPLPGWLSFEPETFTFSGLPAEADMGTYTIRLTAADNISGEAITEFDINVIEVFDSIFEPADFIGWKETFLGWIYDFYPWIYTFDMGWIYIVPQGEGVWAYNYQTGDWFLTNQEEYPFVYTNVSGIYEWRDLSERALDDLKLVGNFIKLADNASYGSRRPHGYGLYNENAEKTFVTWNGRGMSVYARAFDHADQVWTDTYLIWENEYFDTFDYHNYPNMAQAPNGSLLIAYADHVNSLYLLRSLEPNTITGEWEHQLVNEELNGYPMIFTHGDTVYIFYIRNDDDNWPYRSFGYVTSSDNGATWSEHKVAIDSAQVDPDKIDEVYADHFEVEPGGDGQPDRVHFTWVMRGGPEGHNQGSKNLYFAYFVPDSETWQAVDGTDLGEHIDYNEMIGHCVVYDTGPVLDGRAIEGSASTYFDDGTPVVVFNLSGQGGQMAIYENGLWTTERVSNLGIRDIKRNVNGGLRMLGENNQIIEVRNLADRDASWEFGYRAFIPYENYANSTTSASFIDNGLRELEVLLHQVDRNLWTDDYSGRWPVWVIDSTLME